MHICISSTTTKTWKYEEDYPWNLALYIEIQLSKDKEITICKHPSYTIIENLSMLINMIKEIQNDEIEHLVEISRILNKIDPEWRKDFEIIIRKKFISVTIYL